MEHDTTSRFKVIRLCEHHAQALVQLESLCFTHGWNLEEARRAFRQKPFLAYGIMDTDAGEERLLAYVSLYHIDDTLEILNVGVQPERRNQGIGKVLLEQVLRVEAKTGILSVFLEVRNGNSPAIHLYEKLGFVRAGRRRGYYADTGEDALVYTLALPEGLNALKPSLPEELHR